jgi:ribonuclease HII
MHSTQFFLHTDFGSGLLEAGCDEAGRGCLAGPVVAAAVILPNVLTGSLSHSLNDSKKLRAEMRNSLKEDIIQQAIAYGIAMVDHHEIDKINILQASIRAMHLALEQLVPQPELILVDGNRFIPYQFIPYQCIIGGDGRYMSIAAASILAKTWRDEYMISLHDQYPQYHWDRNKGYPTLKHRQALREYGPSPLHRFTFQCKEKIPKPPETINP